MQMDSGGNFDKYLRAANYLTVAQIFLKDNFLVERDLVPEDVKPRLLGHWGSGPGVNFTYSHLSYLAKQKAQEIMFVLGPGHAFPALQANLFLEGTLEKFYPEASQTYEGLSYICKNFSWPYGFPSHSNPGTPGVILEGGELGYSLATSYGAALDNPGLVVACLVGDGEAETGPTAGAWHLNKLLNPRTDGVVLPILHLNGYKISAPTIFGRMSDQELLDLFSGYGYQPRIVSYQQDQNIHEQMQQALEWAHEQIQKARVAEPGFIRLPMIILKTLKGWTGIKELNGQKIEGNCLSHQVVLTEAKTDEIQLRMLEGWLRSYKIQELFDKTQGFGGFVDEVLPTPDKRIGLNKHAFGGEAVYKPLVLPEAEKYSEDASAPGTIGSSSMRRAGEYLNEVFQLNREARNFRLMSPDETYSNKLDKIFESVSRAWQAPLEAWDKDLSPEGRVMEMLSEHNLQGLGQGYVLSGRHMVYASYEAFIQIVASMMDQYAKFLIQSTGVKWRGTIPSFNYILTSSGWRQDHNGFSHQNPGFIDDILRRQGDFADVYFPPDGNSTLAVLENCLSSTRQINVMVAGKTLEPRWLTPQLAKAELEKGLAVWDFASDDNPDLVFCSIGDYLTKEVMAAISIVKNEYSAARLRHVNVLSLTSRGLGRRGNLTHQEFSEYFTENKPVICNFHGYPETIKAILFNYISSSPQRFSIHGYIEHGSTTTPFDMHIRNETSRWHLAIEALERLSAAGRLDYEAAKTLIQKYRDKINQNTEYIKIHGLDMPEVEDWRWKN